MRSKMRRRHRQAERLGGHITSSNFVCCCTGGSGWLGSEQFYTDLLLKSALASKTSCSLCLSLALCAVSTLAVSPPSAARANFP